MDTNIGFARTDLPLSGSEINTEAKWASVQPPLNSFMTTVVSAGVFQLPPTDFYDFFGLRSSYDKFQPGEAFEIHNSSYHAEQEGLFPRNLVSDLAVLRNDGIPSRFKGRDHNVTHSSVRGNASIRLTAEDWPATMESSLGSFAGVSYPQYGTDWSPWPSARMNASYFFSLPYDPSSCVWGTWADWTPSYVTPRCDIVTVLKHLEDKGPFVRSFTQSGWLCYTEDKDLSFATFSDGISITYTHFWRQVHPIYGNNMSGEWIIKIDLSLEERDSWSGYPEYPYEIWANNRYRLRQTVTFNRLWGELNWVSGPVYSVNVGEHEFSLSHTSDEETGFGPYLGSLPSNTLACTQDELLVDFRRFAGYHRHFWLSVERKELYRSSVYAFHDALEDYLGILDNNYVEVLSELKDLPDLIPDVKALLEAIRDFKALNVAGLLRFGDFIAENHLRYAFGIRPTISVISELNSLESRLLDYYSRGIGENESVLYGQFTYPFLLEESRPWLNSVVHTTCICSVTAPESPFLLALFKLYGLRIAPSSQNVWEAIPFSFVVDWFTNMSQRLKHVDLTFLSVMVQVNWSEISFAVESDRAIPTPGDLNRPEQFVDFAHSDYKYRVFHRLLTLYTPMLVEGEIDYLRVGGSPNQGIVGSLLYTLLR
jgi:hypothetical protein